MTGPAKAANTQAIANPLIHVRYTVSDIVCTHKSTISLKTSQFSWNCREMTTNRPTYIFARDVIVFCVKSPDETASGNRNYHVKSLFGIFL